MELIDFLTQDNSQSFKHLFDTHWLSKCKNLMPQYANAFQLSTGNRLRPKLVAWGYSISTGKKISHFDIDAILTVSTSIEMVHKASILLDDFIDSDCARHGLDTFHIQYSSPEAILLSNLLVAEAIVNLESLNINLTNQLLMIIKSMVSGAIKEVSYSNMHIADVTDIIEKETVSLIRGSLLLGAQIESCEPTLLTLLSNVGYDCGTLFQILNDLEPFSNAEKNCTHKGRANFDVENNRKNYVVSFILSNYSVDTVDFSSIINIYTNHKIYEQIMAELNILIQSIDESLTGIQDICMNAYSKSFAYFVKMLIKKCIDRL